MLSKVKTLKGYKLNGLDGEIGKVKEFYFDDLHWTIRYLVANTGNWLTGRRVLISPYALVAIFGEKQCIDINLTKKQIENSPPLNSDEPVSRQFEENYYGYYGWPMYWGGPYSWGSNSYIVHDRERWKEISPGENKTWDLPKGWSNIKTVKIMRITAEDKSDVGIRKIKSGNLTLTLAKDEMMLIERH